MHAAQESTCGSFTSVHLGHSQTLGAYRGVCGPLVAATPAIGEGGGTGVGIRFVGGRRERERLAARFVAGILVVSRLGRISWDGSRTVVVFIDGVASAVGVS